MNNCLAHRTNKKQRKDYEPPERKGVVISVNARRSGRNAQNYRHFNNKVTSAALLY
jgi:hypothetical protein